MTSTHGSLVGGWRVVTTDHPPPSKLASRGPSHATKEEALAEACHRIQWHDAREVSVIRIEGPNGETMDREEIARLCAGGAPDHAS